MNEEKRINAGYEIMESCTIGSTELVIVNDFLRCLYPKNLRRAEQEKTRKG